MTLRFLNPVSITDAEFVSSTRAENDYAAWSGATTYAAGEHAISATTHRIYESVQAGNLNHAPTTDDGTWWIDIGPTNRWAMFDRAVGSVTSQATPLTVVLDPGIISALRLLDVAGNSVHVTMTDGAAGPTIYDETFDVADNAILLDYWDYFFAPITPATTLIVDDLPPYADGRLTVSTAATTTAECGTLQVGDVVEIGEILAGAKVSIIDYSVKETDAYGVTTITERGFALRAEMDVMVAGHRTDYVVGKLTAIRAMPVIWTGHDDIVSLTMLGWPGDWEMAYNHADISNLRIVVQGLST